jgi:hypothetical protein
VDDRQNLFQISSRQTGAALQRWHSVGELVATFIERVRDEEPPIERDAHLAMRAHGVGGMREVHSANLDDFNTGSAGSRNHVGSAPPSGEGNHKIGLTLGKHATIADRTSGATVRVPIRMERLEGDPLGGRPAATMPIRAKGAALD